MRPNDNDTPENESPPAAQKKRPLSQRLLPARKPVQNPIPPLTK
jgi:hypothetical protein